MQDDSQITPNPEATPTPAVPQEPSAEPVAEAPAEPAPAPQPKPAAEIKLKKPAFIGIICAAGVSLALAIVFLIMLLTSGKNPVAIITGNDGLSGKWEFSAYEINDKDETDTIKEKNRISLEFTSNSAGKVYNEEETYSIIYDEKNLIIYDENNAEPYTYEIKDGKLRLIRKSKYSGDTRVYILKKQ